MKTIVVHYMSSYSYGCYSGFFGNEERRRIVIRDEAGTTIKAMLNGLKEREELDQFKLIEAICKGHDELHPVFDAIAEKHKDMVARYWLFEAKHDHIDDSLEPSFWEDIKKGLFTLDCSIEECVRIHKNDSKYLALNLDEQEARQRKIYYCENKEAYLRWVYSNEDYWFIAERIGLALDEVYDNLPDLVFVVNSIE